MVPYACFLAYPKLCGCDPVLKLLGDPGGSLAFRQGRQDFQFPCGEIHMGSSRCKALAEFQTAARSHFVQLRGFVLRLNYRFKQGRAGPAISVHVRMACFPIGGSPAGCAPTQPLTP